MYKKVVGQPVSPKDKAVQHTIYRREAKIEDAASIWTEGTTLGGNHAPTAWVES